MNAGNAHKSGMPARLKAAMLLPVLTAVLYLILFLAAPEKAFSSLKASINIFQNVLIPLVLVLFFIFFLNLFLKPAKVAKLLGKNSGCRGIAVSAAAGIISAGPIYAWYPLLKDLKEKGAGDSLIAVFLYNRAIKLFLLPVMIAYFGLLFVGILTVLMILASVLIGYCIGILMNQKNAV
jgi:uncharacterized membrane protein YraQ (UPF0718 family)